MHWLSEITAGVNGWHGSSLAAAAATTLGCAPLPPPPPPAPAGVERHRRRKPSPPTQPRTEDKAMLRHKRLLARLLTLASDLSAPLPESTASLGNVSASASGCTPAAVAPGQPRMRLLRRGSEVRKRPRNFLRQWFRIEIQPCRVT